jgi:NDP-sugar pyrophosphorylase family protein
VTAAASPAVGADVDAVVLCGGRGTRLASVVSDRPKPLAPVAGRPFLDLLLDALARGLAPRRVVLASGHLADQIAARYGGAPGVLLSPEPEPLGTGGALRLAVDRFGLSEVVVCNGDSFVDLDFAGLAARRRAARAAVAMAVVEAPDAGRFGAVDVQEDRVMRFREKRPDSGPGLVNAGVYAFSAEGLAAIAPGASSLERDLFPRLASEGRMAAHLARGRFIDIGTPQSYRDSQSTLADDVARLGGARPS